MTASKNQVGFTPLPKGRRFSPTLLIERENMTKTASKLKAIEALVKRMRKDDIEILQEMPCCKQNIKNEHDFCEFHYLLNELEAVLNQGNSKREQSGTQ
jgi:hypothetical protein